MSCCRLAACSLLVLACLLPVPGRAAEIDFAHDVAPLLKKHCGACHLGEKKQGGFSMNSRAALIAGGESGPAAVAGKSAASGLLQRVASTDPDRRMPPEGPRLTAAEVAKLRAWIDAGLPWEDGFSFAKSAYEPPLLPRRPPLPPAADGRDHPLDRIVDAYLAAEKFPRPALAGDAAFHRRVSLDVIGLLPEPDRLAAFVADPRPDKRARLVAELLADDLAYAEHWLTFWNDLLRNDYTGTGFITGGRKQITRWLHAALVSNKPYDQFVRELVAPGPESEGFIQGIRWRGNVSASQSQEIQFAQNLSQAFLGINMKCASCHDSFIDRWKLDDAYGLAQIYAAGPLEVFRCDMPTGKQARAAWIFPELGQVDPAAPQPERLRQLAALLTHPQNGRLTRTIVNRLWARLMGRGIVHPVDAMETAPWNADLLDWLASDLADNKFDLKRTIGLICTSAAYQAVTPPGTEAEEAGEYRFRGPLARRMTAEQFVDAVWQVTESAPLQFDAAVVRAAAGPAGSSHGPPAAAWVWSSADASAGAPAGEAIAVRKMLELPAVPPRAVAAITCDNAYELYVNGQKAAADEAWESVESVAIERYLRAGSNELLIVARNGGSGPNPAGLWCEVRLHGADGKVQAVGTGPDWQWSASLPAAGKYARPPADWKPVAAVKSPQTWAAAAAQFAAAVAAAPAHRPARASLLKNDALMRSLGRPNRDQIVTSRPNVLTTLEAIDLANQQGLADAVARGARRLLAEAGGGEAAAESVTRAVFQRALSRGPTAEELELSRAALGERPSEAAVADLLWAVFMLPEFQLVR